MRSRFLTRIKLYGYKNKNKRKKATTKNHMLNTQSIWYLKILSQMTINKREHIITVSFNNVSPFFMQPNI